MIIVYFYSCIMSLRYAHMTVTNGSIREGVTLNVMLATSLRPIKLLLITLCPALPRGTVLRLRNA